MLQACDEAPARWAVDFWVADADLFRRAVLADPEGAAFSVSQLVRVP